MASDNKEPCQRDRLDLHSNLYAGNNEAQFGFNSAQQLKGQTK